MRPLCVIPARHGSKRLPEKNTRPLRGKPMLVYSIEAALESGLFDSVFVSTEDDKIASIATAYGAMAHPRPVELAGDLISATDVCLELYESRRQQGDVFDAIICLQPTSPLRSASDIKESWSIFDKSRADFLVSVTPIDPHYFHWAVHQPSNESRWRMYFGQEFMRERPLLPPVYRPNGAIKIARAKELVKVGNFFGENLTVYEMPPERSVHVGELFDFQLTEFLLNGKKD